MPMETFLVTVVDVEAFRPASGGVARSRLNLIDDCYTSGNPRVPLVFTFSRSKTISGFNIGAGVEQDVGSRPRVRAGYICDGYGNQM